LPRIVSYAFKDFWRRAVKNSPSKSPKEKNILGWFNKGLKPTRDIRTDDLCSCSSWSYGYHIDDRTINTE